MALYRTFSAGNGRAVAGLHLHLSASPFATQEQLRCSAPVEATAELRRAAAQVTTANKKISRASEVAWKQTKRLRQPSRLLAVFGGRRRGGAEADGEEYGDGHDEEGAVDRRPLLSRR